MSTPSRDVSLADLAICFEGGVPAVIATAAADGTPNVTYLSRVRMVDGERVALSNQFLSKTARNLAENPHASVLVLDPRNYDEYRLALVYERTDRRGPVFDRLREDVDTIAALSGMQDVFRLRAADIYRVVAVEHVPAAVHLVEGACPEPAPLAEVELGAVAELTGRLARCGDLDALVDATVGGLSAVLGYDHVVLALHDEEGEQLYTIASHGYPDEGVGSELALGEGTIGLAGQRCAPVRIGNLGQMGKYARTVRRSFEAKGEDLSGPIVPLPVLDDAESQLAVPLQVLGQLVGVLAVESRDKVAFGPADEAALAVVAAVVAAGIEAARAEARDHPESPSRPSAANRPAPGASGTPVSVVRTYAADGSVFVDGEYLIKGVAGRVLCSLLRSHERDGRTEFTNKEVRLDPSLELPELRDNLESRLILLKRRLDERSAPVRIEKTGRGRFRLVVRHPVALEVNDST
ncbi:pyridoxamine 5'-phosphate oxidase family protein [Rhabdothermincola salaria]|uniref:GAF domain-containing protein n=1 Tax=Rhabdothermincola salaria TaxID=2903142 RepID=UPI001E6506F2|nr:pyridoxamine 5'-phosphate oxidase family protein [Rhabdothermincola salaria]